MTFTSTHQSVGFEETKDQYQAFLGVLIDSIVELLVLIIKPFDNQTESWNPVSNDLIIKSFDISFDNQWPPSCRNSWSDRIGLDDTPPMLLEVYDGYEEGVDWQQQGFVNSIFGNCKAYDDVSGISEYEWSYRLNGSFSSSGSSRIMAKLDLTDIEQDATAFVCARAVNKAGLRSSTLCSDGVLKGLFDISFDNQVIWHIIW